MQKQVILTGLRANGEFTLGNYLGAILPMVEMQRKHTGQYQINMFVPDLHSFTTEIKLSILHAQILQNLRIYIASGLDIEDKDTFLYRQSYIAPHSELTVILNNFTYFGELQRMTQFKEKIAESKDKSISAGLFDYPVLMAADILLYGAQWVMVGEDQRQHVELTRDIALRLNNRFDDNLFEIPAEWQKQLEFSLRDSGVRIRSLKNPSKKMSKSVEDPSGTILLSDSPDEAGKKIMSATTDSIGMIHYDFENQPGISNLLQILGLLTFTPLSELKTQWEGMTNYSDLKKAVASEVEHFLEDFQKRLAEVNDNELINKLETSEKQMLQVASQRLLRVQQAAGLRP